MADSNRCQAVGHVGETKNKSNYTFILPGYMKKLQLVNTVL